MVNPLLSTIVVTGNPYANKLQMSYSPLEELMTKRWGMRWKIINEHVEMPFYMKGKSVADQSALFQNMVNYG